MRLLWTSALCILGCMLQMWQPSWYYLVPVCVRSLASDPGFVDLVLGIDLVLHFESVRFWLQASDLASLTWLVRPLFVLSHHLK